MVTLLRLALVLAACSACVAVQQASLRELLISSADWLLDHNTSGICEDEQQVRRSAPAPGWTGKRR